MSTCSFAFQQASHPLRVSLGLVFVRGDISSVLILSTSESSTSRTMSPRVPFPREKKAPPIALEVIPSPRDLVISPPHLWIMRLTWRTPKAPTDIFYIMFHIVGVINFERMRCVVMRPSFPHVTLLSIFFSITSAYGLILCAHIRRLPFFRAVNPAQWIIGILVSVCRRPP